jgi:hypothetical protein
VKYRSPTPAPSRGRRHLRRPRREGSSRRTTSTPISVVVTSLIDAGLRIEFLHEFPFSTYQFLPFTERRPDGTVRLTKHDGCVPLLYSIKATKPPNLS